SSSSVSIIIRLISRDRSCVSVMGELLQLLIEMIGQPGGKRSGSVPDGEVRLIRYRHIGQNLKLHTYPAWRDSIPGLALGQGGWRAANQHRSDSGAGMQRDIGAATTKADGLCRRGSGPFREQN